MAFRDLFKRRETIAEETRYGRRLTETDDAGVILGTHYIGSGNPFYDFAAWDSWRTGLSIPGSRRAALLIADLVAGFPRKAYTEYAGKRKEQLDPNPMVLERPNPPDTGYSTYHAWALDYLFNGNAMGLIVDRDADGRPTLIVPLYSREVSVRRNPNTYRVEYEIGAADGPRTVDYTEILHVKGPHRPGDLRGSGPLEYGLSTYTFAAATSERWTNSFNTGVPNGILRHTGDGKVVDPDTGQRVPMTPAMAATIKAQWEATSGIKVVGGPWEFQPISWSPSDLQLEVAHKLSNEQFANLYGVPGYFLNVENSSRTYSNVTEEGMNLLRYTLNGYVLPFEEALSNLFPNKTYVKFNTDSILRADTKGRYDAYATAIDKGFLTVDEVRALEDRPPLEGENGD